MSTESLQEFDIKIIRYKVIYDIHIERIKVA